MTIEMLKEGLMWCTLINMVMLTLWFVMFVAIHDLIYKMHSKWFKLSVATFDGIHYAGMAFFKTSIFVFNLVPYIVLVIVT